MSSTFAALGDEDHFSFFWEHGYASVRHEILAGNDSFREEHRAWYAALFNRFDGIVSEAAFRHYRAVFGLEAHPP